MANQMARPVVQAERQSALSQYLLDVFRGVMFHMIHTSDHPEASKLMRRAYRHVLDVPEADEQLTLELSESQTS